MLEAAGPFDTGGARLATLVRLAVPREGRRIGVAHLAKVPVPTRLVAAGLLRLAAVVPYEVPRPIALPAALDVPLRDTTALATKKAKEVARALRAVHAAAGPLLLGLALLVPRNALGASVPEVRPAIIVHGRRAATVDA